MGKDWVVKDADRKPFSPEDLREPVGVRARWEERHPLWKRYYCLQDAMIDQEIDVRETVERFLVLGHDMLVAADSRKQAREFVVGMENLFTDVLLLFPDYSEVFDDSLEDQLMGWFDSLLFDDESVDEQLARLRQELSLYVESLDDAPKEIDIDELHKRLVSLYESYLAGQGGVEQQAEDLDGPWDGSFMLPEPVEKAIDAVTGMYMEPRMSKQRAQELLDGLKQTGQD